MLSYPHNHTGRRRADPLPGIDEWLEKPNKMAGSRNRAKPQTHTESNPPILEVDLHGLKRSAGIYRVRVIHGYRGGTELRDMVWYEFANHPLVKRIVPGDNEGITELVLREYY